MPSDKSRGVFQRKIEKPDNQQERLKTIGWIVGYTDGEGCFSVSMFRNKTTKYGWQVFPEFVVTQGEKSRKSLTEIQDFFRCGKIFENNRKDNHREKLLRYCVRNRKELTENIIPFFVQYPLRTAKKEDFKKFVQIVIMMNRGLHKTLSGLKRIASIIENMNRKTSSRFLKSSETTRQASSQN